MKQYNLGEFNYFDDSGGFCCSGEPGDYGKSVDFGYWYLCWFGEYADSSESTDSSESDGFETFTCPMGRITPPLGCPLAQVTWLM